MKKILLLIAGVVAIVGIHSCTKDTINGDVSAYEMGAYLVFNQDVPSSPQLFDLSDITNSAVSIDVKTVGTAADVINIYVGTSTDGSDWSLIKTVSFADSATLSVSGSELAAALGVDAASFTAGDEFTFFNEVVTTDGRTFSMANTSSDFESQTPYKMAFRWYATVFCAFDASVFTGNFEVITDDWADYAVGDVITGAVEPGPGTNQLTLHVYPNLAAYPDAIVYDPIIVDVDPATNEATVADVHYGDYGGGYDMNASGYGSVSSCSKTISLTLDHHAGSITFGEFKIVIQKKE
jgi:hypothetical protein